MKRPPSTVHHKFLKSFDGTRIAYQVLGSGKRTIVLCNGLGGFLSAWKSFYNSFQDQYQFICWDYRGLFRSALPADSTAIRIEDHVDDLRAILKKEKVRDFLLVGWSMGVQVALEYYRRTSEGIQGLLLINGTSGYPFDTALNNPLCRYILPALNRAAARVAPALQPTLTPLANRIVGWPGFIQIISKLGLAHENIKPEIIKEVLEELLQTDMGTYHRILTHLSEHTCEDILESVDVPSLVIAGSHDIITPIKAAEKMARLIPKSAFFIVPSATHYCFLEFPDIVNFRVAQFLKEYFHPERTGTAKRLRSPSHSKPRVKGGLRP